MRYPAQIRRVNHRAWQDERRVAALAEAERVFTLGAEHVVDAVLKVADRFGPNEVDAVTAVPQGDGDPGE